MDSKREAWVKGTGRCRVLFVFLPMDGIPFSVFDRQLSVSQLSVSQQNNIPSILYVVFV